MIKETLSRLLEDPNVPRDLMARAVTAGLEAWQAGTLGQDAPEFIQEFTRYHPEFQLKGPPSGLPGPTIRVTRVMSEQTFVHSQVQSGDFPSVETSRYHLQDLLDSPRSQQLLGDRRPWAGRWGTTWVTLADEIGDSPHDVVADNLGLGFWGPERLLAISYSIASSDLLTPTLFDAHGSPYFASKPVGGVPRAWNWTTSEPGLIEVVHSSSAKVADLSISSLGEIGLPRVRSPFKQIALPISPRVADAVKYALRTAEARSEITAFLDEQSNFLHLTDREFELFLGALYKLRGYDASVTQATRDGGFDVIAVRETDTREQILLQAKKTAGTVGVSVIRELAGARYFAGAKHEGSILVVATTGKFSQPARQLEHQHASELRLHDYAALKDMVSTARGVTLTDIAQDAVKLSRLG